LKKRANSHYLQIEILETSTCSVRKVITENKVDITGEIKNVKNDDYQIQEHVKVSFNVKGVMVLEIPNCFRVKDHHVQVTQDAQNPRV
jgi:hypothetical protein